MLLWQLDDYMQMNVVGPYLKSYTKNYNTTQYDKMKITQNWS